MSKTHRQRKRTAPTKREMFYLSKPEQTHLENILNEIPGMAADLAVAITMQERLGERTRGSRHPSVHPMPVNLRAAEVAAELQSALVTTTRLVCEQRDIEFLPVGYNYRHGEMIGPLREGERRLPPDYDESSMPCQARWLMKNMMSLLLTEGADGCHAEIDRAFKRALKVVWPPYRPIVLDPVKVEDARSRVLNAAGIEELSRKLGEEYRNLTFKRVHNLHKNEHITPVAYDGASPLFEIGKVLDAHLTVPVRRKA